MASAEGLDETLFRRRMRAGDGRESELRSESHACDYDAIRVNSQPNFVKRWNNIVAGFLWTLYHFYLTYNLILGVIASDDRLSFLLHKFLLLVELAVYWGLLALSVYGVLLYDNCIRFHNANFEAFPKMYSDHAIQDVLMRSDFKNYSLVMQLYGAIFLSPMRMSVFILFFAMSVVLIGLPLAIIGDRCKEQTRQYVAFMFHYLTRFGFWGIGISEVRTVYAEGAARDGPRNVISNHIGILDTIYMLHSGAFSFVCKHSLDPTFIIGHFIRLLKCITVDRHCTKDRKEAYSAIVERMKSVHQGRENVSMVVYPEGTTSRGNILLPFKHGAFGALVPLQPLLIVLDYNYVNIAFDIYCWEWWTIQVCCSPATVRLIAYWLPEIRPPTMEIAPKGERDYVREYSLHARGVMRDAMANLNPNVDAKSLESRGVVVTPALRTKLLARLFGPVIQRYYNISDSEMRKTEEVIFH